MQYNREVAGPRPRRAGGGTASEKRAGARTAPADGDSQESAPFDIRECATRSIAEDVINRLVTKADLRQARSQGLPDAELDSLCDALISDDPDAAAALVDRARRDGVSPDRLYLSYIAGAARRLGERWDDDRTTFVEVTLGLSRLHQIMRDLGPVFFATQSDGGGEFNALFATAPGESHVLGVVMAADFFRRHGWHVDVDTCSDDDSLLNAAANRPYSLIGISASTRRMKPVLARVVPQLRFASESAALVIGGHITQIEPGIAEMTGADAIASDVSVDAHELKDLVVRRSRLHS